MRFLRPIPRRLLPDDMVVWPTDGAGSFGEARSVRHVRFETVDSVVDDAHRSSAVAGKVYVDAESSVGAFEVPAGSRVRVGSMTVMRVRSCKRCCGTGGRVHHWELGVG